MPKRVHHPSSSSRDHSPELDDFSALLQREFRPDNRERKSRVEAAVQTLATQALKDAAVIGDNVTETVENMLRTIEEHQKRHPELHEKLAHSAAELRELVAYMDERAGAQDLLDRVLKDPDLLKALSGAEGQEPSEAAPADEAAPQSSLSGFDKERFQRDLAQRLAEVRKINNRVVLDFLQGNRDQAAMSRSIKGTLHSFRIDNQRELLPLADWTRGRFLVEPPRDLPDVIKSSLAYAEAIWENEGEHFSFLKARLSGQENSQPSPPLAERLERLAEFARDNDDIAVQRYAAVLIPEWSIGEQAKTVGLNAEGPPLPTEAPEKYQGLRGPETPPAFVKRVYGEWLGHGLTRSHINKLDPSLYRAIDNWSRKPGNEWPAEVDLPTKSQEVGRKVERLQAGEVLGEFTLREMQRMSAAVQRRRDKREK